MSIQPLLEPELRDHAGGQADGRWMVVMFNNDTNSMDEVMDILIYATQCDEQEAFIEMWEAHTFGKASVHFASKSECDTVATLISSIGVRTEVSKEWLD
jgi:ATP-dependent Clp protease adaptor protein ClpS